MNHWPFIWAAYAITTLGTVFVIVHSWIVMRRAERAVADMERDQ